MSGTPKYDDPDWLEEQYYQHGLTLQDIADKTTVSETTIFRRMEAFEIDRGEYQQEQNLPSSQNRPLSPRINSYGHREFTNSFRGEQFWVMVHRLHATLLVSNIDELQGKEVHHLNGCPFDNRLENYEIVEKSVHQRKHRFTGNIEYKSLCTTCESVSYFFDIDAVSYCPSCATEFEAHELVPAEPIDWKIDH